MKTLILILLLCFSAQSQVNLDDQIKTFKNRDRFTQTYDRFKDETSVQVGPFYVVGASLGMTAHFQFKGVRQKRPVDTVALLFVSHSSEWLFLRDNDLYAIIDGERTSFGEGVRASRVAPTYSRYSRLALVEVLAYRVPLPLFHKLGAARTVEMRVGPYEFKCKEEHIEAFRDLARLMREDDD